MASFFRNPPRTYSRRGKPAAPTPAPVDKDRAPLSDHSLNKEQGRIVQDHLFSSSDNLESSSSFSRPKRLVRTAKSNNLRVKENSTNSTLDSDVSRKRKGENSDESSFDLSGCLSRAKELKAKKGGSNLKSQKSRTQPTRASQRAKTTTERKKKPAAKETVNTTDEFEKPKAKRLKKSNSKSNVSTAAEPVKPLRTSKSAKVKEPENIPDFKDFEDYELAVETTINKSPEKADVNLLSPLRENSWENISKTDLETKEHVADEKGLETEKDALETDAASQLEATKDYSNRRTTSASSKNETDFSSSETETDQAPKSSKNLKFAPHRDVNSAHSSPFPSQVRRTSALPRSRSLRPNLSSSSSSSPISARKDSIDDDDTFHSASPRHVASEVDEKKVIAISSTDSASPLSDAINSSSDGGVGDRKDAPSTPMVSISVAPYSVAESIEMPSQRIITFPTPRRREELQDFSCISFCSPVVAGNLTYDEDGPDVPVMGLKVNYLRRIESQTSTPVQSLQKKMFKFMNGSMGPGSPIVHTSIEKQVSSPVWNNVTKRKRFGAERNRSSNSLSGDSSMTQSRKSGSPIPIGARNRQRRNATSNSSASFQDSKPSLDLFEASNSAFEPSLKVVKEAPAKLSLSHIVEESGESLRVPLTTDHSIKSDVNMTSQTEDREVISSKIDELTSRNELTSMERTEPTEMASIASSTACGVAESGISSIAATNDVSRDVIDDDDDSPLKDNLDLLSPGFVGRGSLPNLRNSSAVASLWTNHSCPDIGRQRPFDFLIEILIDEEPHMIGCCVGDDPEDVASEFIVENNINPEQLAVLTEFIAGYLRTAEQEEVEGVPETVASPRVNESLMKSSVLMDLTVGEESVQTDGRVGDSKKNQDSLLSKSASSIAAPYAAWDRSAASSSPGDVAFLPSVDASSLKSSSSPALADLTTPTASFLAGGTSTEDPCGSAQSSSDESISTFGGSQQPYSSDGDGNSLPEEVNLEVDKTSPIDASIDVPAADVDDAISAQSTTSEPAQIPNSASKPVSASSSNNIFSFDRRATISFKRQAPVEKSRRGSRLSLAATKSRLSHLEAPNSDDPRSSSDRRMSRLLRNGKTFLDTSPVKNSPPFPPPPLMTLVDVIRGEELEKVQSPVEPSPTEARISDAPSVSSKSSDHPSANPTAPTNVFKMPTLPAPKPKVNMRRSTRASAVSAASEVEEKETRRRSIARNLRKSKKIVFSPGEEMALNQMGVPSESGASPVLNRKGDRRATVAVGGKSDMMAGEERRATIMMTPIQKLAQWRRGSMVAGTPLSSTKSITPSETVAPILGTSEAFSSKAARSLKVNFETVVTAPIPSVQVVAAAPDVPAPEDEPTSNSPVVVLKRLSSEDIASFTAPVVPATPVTPAWKRSQRLLASPIVILSPLVRHLRPAYLETSLASPFNLTHETSLQLNESMGADDARSRVLEVCNQTTELSFYDVYNKKRMAAMKKIGEGTYGEVYLSFDEFTQQPVALKVIPIEGDDLVNDERQKTYAEMLSEAVITKEMSELSSGDTCLKENVTSGFIRVNRICAFKGVYPRELLKKWDEWSRKNKSWNDRPDFYGDDQLFLVFEFSEGGSDLEKFKFGCPLDALSVFRQTMMALAVGESELEFEHRDLHWGNILIKKLDSEDTIEYVLNGVRGEMQSCVRVAIIDFTLSRLKRGGLTQFTDLADDPDIFMGVGEEAGSKDGDYQFDCYRLMQDETENEWKSHAPRTNVIWLHYLAKKLLGKMNSMTKKQRSTVNWKTTFEKLSLLQLELLKCSSVGDVVGLVATL